MRSGNIILENKGMSNGSNVMDDMRSQYLVCIPSARQSAIPNDMQVCDKTDSFISTEQSSTIRVSPSGTLIIDKIEATMKGSYTCTADNAFGKPIKKTIFISVNDSPAVAPFIFPPALKEGDRASVICTITSGDRPLQFKWKKDGQDISNFMNIKTQSITDSSVLIIEPVTSKSSGNYSCIISNSHGSDTFTALLTVTAPPEWIKEPEDIFTQEGNSLNIECEASGVPKPNVKWTSGIIHFSIKLPMCVLTMIEKLYIFSK
ncbi:cell adhesion molecule Dscam2-like [Uloborus diversus]|uniref:cell adhesion molecule Dscam2-like n=1 Tax=Uloborus diversus TaxID=327109 RepID=UPI002409D889|nr:cell adhesion molecule Dscam2-like [Uloborus diversus]